MSMCSNNNAATDEQDNSIFTVKSVSFNVLSAADAEKFAVVEIGGNTTNAINSPMLGTLSNLTACQTCGEKTIKCTGHTGFLRLTSPLLHPMFLGVTLAVLRRVCHRCGEYSNNFRRTNKVEQTCDHCSAVLALRVRRQAADILVAYTAGPETLDGPGVLAVLEMAEQRCGERLRTELRLDPTLKLADLVIRVLSVPPPAIRPAWRTDASLMEDTLTLRLRDIIKRMHDVETAMMCNDEQGRRVAQLNAQCALNVYFDSKSKIPTIRGVTEKRAPHNNTSKTARGFRDRLDRKGGRVRIHIQGKRCNFSARTVVTGDPLLKINEVGLPIAICQVLTFPETVTVYNMESLHTLVQRGVHGYPGANVVLRGGSETNRFSLITASRSTLQLEVGDVVERHIQKGDIVLINRQPTLHRLGAMAHHVVPCKFATVRLPVSAAKPYNADFDGDEMNIHVPQSYWAQAELSVRMTPATNLFLPGTGRPVFTLVQDSLLAAFLLTEKSVFFTKAEMWDMLAQTDNALELSVQMQAVLPAVIKPRELWTGCQLLTMFLPLQATYGTPDTTDAEGSDGGFMVRNGQVLSGGVGTKEFFGDGGNSNSLMTLIGHHCCDGGETAVGWLHNINRMLLHWITSVGFSVTPVDLMLPALVREKLNGVRKNAHLFSAEHVNAQVQFVWQDLQDWYRGRRNNILRLAAGSKGTPLVLRQTVVGLGQQVMSGAAKDHVKREINGQGQENAREAAFVPEGFADGLTTTGFFCHASEGRHGLVDTTVKTAETGYMQRRTIKLGEHVTSHPDGTVRLGTEHGTVVLQLMYGSDGVAPGMAHVPVQLPPGFEDGDNFARVYGNNSTSGALVAPGEDLVALGLCRERLCAFTKMYPSAILPLDVPQCLAIVTRKTVTVATTRAALLKAHETLSVPTPLAVLQLAQEAVQVVRAALYYPSEWSSNILSITADERHSGLIECVRGWLSASILTALSLTSSDDLATLLKLVKFSIKKCRLQCGEAVGVIVAQSLGEPATQMTLNTFKTAGNMNDESTPSLRKVYDLLNGCKKISDSYCTVRPIAGIVQSELASCLKSKLVQISLQTIATHWQLVYDPPRRYDENAGGLDAATLALWYDKNIYSASQWKNLVHSLRVGGLYTPLVIRIALSATAMGVHNIQSLKEVTMRIDSVLRWGDAAYVHSDENDDEPFIRIRVPIQLLRTHGTEQLLTRWCNNILATIVVAGGMAHGNEQVTRVQQVDSDQIRVYPSILSTVLADERVDSYTVTSSNPRDALLTLGIDAANRVLRHALAGVYTSNDVEFRHIMLLADTITAFGSILPVTRYGVGQQDTGPIARCCHEEATKVLGDASLAGLTDSTNGAAACVMFGKRAAVGTGLVQCTLDTGVLKSGEEKPHEDTAAVAHAELSTSLDGVFYGHGGASFSPEGDRGTSRVDISEFTPCRGMTGSSGNASYLMCAPVTQVGPLNECQSDEEDDDEDSMSPSGHACSDDDGAESLHNNIATVLENDDNESSDGNGEASVVDGELSENSDVDDEATLFLEGVFESIKKC